MSAQGQGVDETPYDPQILLGIKTFRQPLWRSVVQAGLFFTIAVIGFSMILGQPPRPDIGWPVAVLGVTLGVLLPGMATYGGRRRVDLYEEGFVVHSLFTTSRHRWTEVSEFTLATVLPGRGMRQAYVVYDVAGDRGLAIRFNRFLTGRGWSLPIGLEPTEIPGNAVTIVLVMNAWRARALSRVADASA